MRWKYMLIWLILASFHFQCTDHRASKVVPLPNSNSENSKPDSVTARTIIFFGNSITAGYGLDPAEAFPNLIQLRIDSLHLPYKVINAGVSGETSSGGKNRIDWILRQPVSVFVLELGGNDGLRGIPLAETTQNLQTIIDKVKKKYPEAEIILAGMKIPPNLGGLYTHTFEEIFPELAKKNQIHLIPFLMEGVGGVDSLMQSDGIHPNARGDRLMAETVWQVLKGLLRV